MPISARSFWNRNRSRETRGGRGEAGRSASKTRHSFPTPSSQPTRSETRRRSSPAAGRPLAASIYASANANRPRLSLCTPSVLPSIVRPSVVSTPLLHPRHGACGTSASAHSESVIFVAALTVDRRHSFIRMQSCTVFRHSTCHLACYHPDRMPLRSLIDKSTHSRHMSHL